MLAHNGLPKRLKVCFPDCGVTLVPSVNGAMKRGNRRTEAGVSPGMDICAFELT
jgi:hypothetical protein